MLFLVCLAISLFAVKAIAYNQADLLNAQTNFQSAKSNLDSSKTKLSHAQDDVAKAESDVQYSKKSLENAQKNLKNKQESEVAAKHAVATSTTVFHQSGVIVDNIWNEVNGKSAQGKPSGQ